jgi:hypothetical protein
MPNRYKKNVRYFELLNATKLVKIWTQFDL